MIARRQHPRRLQIHGTTAGPDGGSTAKLQRIAVLLKGGWRAGGSFFWPVAAQGVCHDMSATGERGHRSAGEGAGFYPAVRLCIDCKPHYQSAQTGDDDQR